MESSKFNLISTISTSPRLRKKTSKAFKISSSDTSPTLPPSVSQSSCNGNFSGLGEVTGEYFSLKSASSVMVDRSTVATNSTRQSRRRKTNRKSFPNIPDISQTDMFATRKLSLPPPMTGRATRSSLNKLITRNKCFVSGGDNLDAVLEKIQNENLLVLLLIQLEESTPIENEITYHYCYNKINMISLIVCHSVETIKEVLPRLQFLKTSENKGKLRVLVHYPLKPPPEKEKDITKLLLQATSLVLAEHRSSSIQIYVPSLPDTSSAKLKREFEKKSRVILFDETENSIYDGNTTERMSRLLKWCSFTKVMFLGELDKRSTTLYKTKGITVIVKKTLESAKSYILTRPNLENPCFRIVVSLQEDAIHILELLRKSLRINSPILFFLPESPLKAGHYETYPRISHTNDKAVVTRYCEMVALEWAPDLSEGTASSLLKWEGYLMVMAIRGTDLASKDTNGLSDPYIKFTLNNTKYKTKKQLKTLDPYWDDFTWEAPCNGSDFASFEIWDWDQLSTDDYMGEVKFNLFSLLSEFPKDFDGVFISKTFQVRRKKSYTGTVSGTLTITFAYKLDKQQRSYHFGKPLQESLEYCGQNDVEHPTIYILDKLMQTGTQCEGIIRIPGNKSAIHQLKEQIDSGGNVEALIQTQDPFNLAGLLKLYLSELPDSLIPEQVYNQLCQISLTTENLPLFKKMLKEEGPKPNLEIMSPLCKYFRALCDNTERTMMTSENLGISIGPTLLLSPQIREDPVAFLSNSVISAQMLAFIIANAEEIFDWKK